MGLFEPKASTLRIRVLAEGHTAALNGSVP